jgi:hypothetical protein
MMKLTRRIWTFAIIGGMMLMLNSCGKRQHSCAAYDRLDHQALEQ